MFQNHRKSSILLIVLLVVDFILITLHFLHRLVYRGFFESAILSSTIFSMSEEAQLPDLFHFSKQLAIVLLLLYLAKNKNRIYAAWAAIFGYLLIDDVFQIHESVGYALERTMPPIGALEASEVAQNLFLIVLSLVLFGAALLIIWKAEGDDRLASVYLMLLLAAAAFFGVIVDFVQGFVMDMFGISGVVKIIEDGGEMIIISVILWFVYRLAYETMPQFNYMKLVPNR